MRRRSHRGPWSARRSRGQREAAYAVALALGCLALGCIRGKPADLTSATRLGAARVERAHAMSTLHAEAARMRLVDARVASAVALTRDTSALVEVLFAAFPRTRAPEDRATLDAQREALDARWRQPGPTWERPVQRAWVDAGLELIAAIDHLCARVDEGDMAAADLAYNDVVAAAWAWQQAARALGDATASDRDGVWGHRAGPQDVLRRRPER